MNDGCFAPTQTRIPEVTALKIDEIEATRKPIRIEVGKGCEYRGAMFSQLRVARFFSVSTVHLSLLACAGMGGFFNRPRLPLYTLIFGFMRLRVIQSKVGRIAERRQVCLQSIFLPS